jgi:hypothetical protein
MGVEEWSGAREEFYCVAGVDGVVSSRGRAQSFGDTWLCRGSALAIVGECGHEP